MEDVEESRESIRVIAGVLDGKLHLKRKYKHSRSRIRGELFLCIC